MLKGSREHRFLRGGRLLFKAASVIATLAKEANTRAPGEPTSEYVPSLTRAPPGVSTGLENGHVRLGITPRSLGPVAQSMRYAIALQ
jgi:hypothetical protein